MKCQWHDDNFVPGKRTNLNLASAHDNEWCGAIVSLTLEVSVDNSQHMMFRTSRQEGDLTDTAPPVFSHAVPPFNSTAPPEFSLWVGFPSSRGQNTAGQSNESSHE